MAAHIREKTVAVRQAILRLCACVFHHNLSTVITVCLSSHRSYQVDCAPCRLLVACYL